MKKTTFAAAAILLLAALCPAQTPAGYEARFTDKALRVDLYQVGDAAGETLTVDAIYEEPLWPETRTRLVDPFGYGRYVLEIYDVASNALIYSRGFDTMFAEYKTTNPALEGTKRVFQRSVRFPEPKRPFLFVVEARDKKNLLHPVFSRTVDPADYHIIREAATAGDWIYEPVVSGDPRRTMDLVFLAEGYTAAGKDKFKADVDRMTQVLFATEPYKSAKARISIRAVFRPSPEKSMDEPRQRAYRKTVLSASFNAFDLDRYMLIERDHLMHEIAAQVPYDAIVVLVDSARYGGGSIAFDYCVTTTDHARSLEVFLHEMGHSFGGLADEYYASEVSYNDFYPKGVEPFEPNITALLDPADVKWKNLLSPGIGIPTEYGKDAEEALMAESRAKNKAAAEEIARAKERGADAAALKAIQDRLAAEDKEIKAKIAEIRKKYEGLADKVGVFEGAGYASKGLYRPQKVCLMIGNPKREFCAVCRKALTDMIDYFTGK
ncbi:MAG: M64 family metallopeptidase [Acidobacteriota bacterium]|nr:M64 family metallopeptidase [Acidobacteriota bacterium]